MVLFEALAGRRPYAGSSDSEVVMALLRGERGDLARFRRDVPAPCVAWVHKLLEPDRSRRYQSANDALDALVELGSGLDGSRRLVEIMGAYADEKPITAVATCSELPYATGPTEPRRTPHIGGGTVEYSPNPHPADIAPVGSHVETSRGAKGFDNGATRTMQRARGERETPRRRGIVFLAAAILVATVLVAVAVGYALAR